MSEIILKPQQVDLIKRTIAPTATDDELALFLHYCQSQGFDPLAKDVYFTKRTNHKTGKSTTAYVTSIDTFRSRAEDTGQYAGNDDPIFDNEEKPNKATVTVYKLVAGTRCPFQASARWDQYYPGDVQGFMWNKMPHLMLGKCAEALALRKAFPKQFKKLYVREEMEQAGNDEEHRAGKQESNTMLHGSSERAGRDWNGSGVHSSNTEGINRKTTDEASAPQKDDRRAAPATEIYTGTTEQQEKIKKHCEAEKIPDQYWSVIDQKLQGKPYTKINVGAVIREAMKA